MPVAAQCEGARIKYLC